MEILGFIITIVLALTGYFLTYFNNLRLAKRADKLRLITTQIDELYGPLYVITQTGQMLYKALQAKSMREGKDEIERDSPEWRIWVQEVFLPLNIQLEQTIINKAYLIIEKEMPQTLKRFLAHSAGYKAVIKKWQSGDFTESSSIISYPDEIIEYAEISYLKLKEQQNKWVDRVEESETDT